MKSIPRLLGQVLIVAVGGMAGLVIAPNSGAAQESQPLVYDEAEVGHNTRDLWQTSSYFRLFGEGDRAVTSTFPTGTTPWGRGMEFYITNTGITDGADLNLDSQPDIATANGRQFTGFDNSPLMGAPREEWARFVAIVPSLANATGGGWASSRNMATLGTREIMASDLEFGTAFSGVQSTADGGCRDQTADATSSIAAGLTLLAMSNCNPTWPLVAGVPTFKGRRPITLDAYANAQTALGADFQFDFWRIDPADVNQAKLFGNFQTYGAYDDYNSSMIGRFGNVVPGGAGDPLDEGWPLGIRTEFDAFTFALPTVGNTEYWQATLINNTEDVYGVGLDYEKLTVGYSFNAAHGTQETQFYSEVWRGAIQTAESNTGDPSCPGVAPPGVGFVDCTAGHVGANNGATTMIVLKSPIGDLRNVLLTCDPATNAARAANSSIPCTTDAFNDPTNPHAGDTITYNHMSMCPYGSTCGSETWVSSIDRQTMGNFASNTEDVLNGRDIGSLSAGFQYATWRNPNFPQQPTPYSYWVPGTWDYTANGTGAPDTIFVPTCYGPPGVVIQGTTREDREDACTVTWSDTMPVGELGNPAYNNQEGNMSHWAVGPFMLAAGDTTALVIAYSAAGDSIGIDNEVNNAIDLYMNFYLSPEAPPVVNIVGVQVDIQDPSSNEDGLRGEITLWWDDANNPYTDQFLWKFAEVMEAATAGDLLRLKTLNPTLVDDIYARAVDNLQDLIIYKSCDGGSTFTSNDQANGILDCDADPAQDLTGASVGSGWQAYSVLPVNDAGIAPNSFVDDNNIAGQTYLYVITGRTRGAQFAIVDSTDADGDGSFDIIAPDSLLLAPQLANPIATATTEPNVASVYMPGTAQAGSQAASATFTELDVTGHGTGSYNVIFTGALVVEDEWRTTFFNEFEVATVRNTDGDIVTTRVVSEDHANVETSPTTAVDSVINRLTLQTDNPNGVQTAGTAAELIVGDTTFQTLTDLGFVLYRVPAAEPFMVSTVLDSANTTPSAFLDRTASGDWIGYPGIVMAVDNSGAGLYDRQRQLYPTRDTIPNEILPTVVYEQGSSVSTPGVTAYGEYDIAWSDFTFGPDVQFTLNFANPAETQAAYTASLAARNDVTTGRTDDEAAAAIGVTAADLVPATFPFTVSNVTFGRTADVAMLRRVNNDVLLGDIGSQDTLTVTADSLTWIPGDEIYFLETVTLDSVGASGGLVLGGNGQPIQVQTLAATLAPAVVSCANSPRATCNPVEGPGSTLDWVTSTAGQTLAVFYFAPYNTRSQLTFVTQSAQAGVASIDAGADIQAQMDSVHVVPNPYIMFSAYEVDTPGNDDARLMFTHLPPEGTLRIFTVSGQFVQELNWVPSDLAGNGDLFWNIRTREGTNAGSGLYLFTVVAINPADGQELKKIGKFVIIR